MSLPGQDMSVAEARYKTVILASFACGRQDQSPESYLEQLLNLAKELTALSARFSPAPADFLSWLTVSRTQSANIKLLTSAFEKSIGAEVLHEDFPSITFECYGALGRKAAVKALSRSDKATVAADHIAFTQILTPPWVVETIFNLTLGAKDEALEKSLSELQSFRILDPCAGTGNFLIEALHRLSKRYLSLAVGKGEAVALALAHNLYAADIDSQALSIYILRLAALILKTAEEKVLLPERLNIACTAAENSPEKVRNNSQNLGSLELSLPASHLLNQKYDLVVTNPPYLGRRLIDRALKTSLKNHYPDCPSDISLCFLDRSMSWAKPHGKIGFITQASLLHLPSSKELRRKILSATRVDCIIECGSNVFPLISGEKVDNIILTLKNAPPEENLSRYLNLTAIKEKAQAARQFSLSETMPEPSSITRAQSDFSKSEDLAINFNRPDFLCRLPQRAQSLGALAELKQGLATSDNERFLRYTWEVDPSLIGKDWFNYCKGQGSRRWYGPRETLIYYKDQGAELKEAVLTAYPYLKGKSHWVVKNEEYYFKAGLTFTLISARALAVRKMPQGSIFDVGGSAIFAAEDEDFLLAYLNSDLATAFARDINPTINYQVGDLKKIPVPQTDRTIRAKLAELALSAVQTAENIAKLREPHFFALFESADGSAYQLNGRDYKDYLGSVEKSTAKLCSIEAEINELVFAAWSKDLGKAEKEALRHWMQDSQSKEALPIKSDQYLLMVLANALVKEKTACSLSDDSILSQLTGMAIDLEPDFIAEAAPQGLLTFLKERLLKYLTSTYNHQPPSLALEAGGKLHIFPTSMILESESKSRLVPLPDTHSSVSHTALNELIANLKQKCPAAKRSRDILKAL